jgi:hypothetical protein
MVEAKTRLPSAYDTYSYCLQLPSELKMRRLRNMRLNRTTYVKACNIEVKFELAEIGTEMKKKLLIHKTAALRGEWDVLREDDP